MKVGDLVKSKLGNTGIILASYKLDDGIVEKLFVDIRWSIRWSSGHVKTCYPAYRLEVISESR